MAITYFILQSDGQIQDGETFADWRKMLAALAFAETDARVIAFDTESLIGTDNTLSAAQDLWAERYFFAAEDSEFLVARFGQTYTQADHDADKADARRHEVSL